MAMSRSSSVRNLSKNELGGVIFGCTHDTMKECVRNQLFGLPLQHMSYVQNIEPGMPLFLFNYSDRKLYGIFEAVSHGQLNIDPYGWSSNSSERTKYPAQVRIRTRMQCEPLPEIKFKPVIVDNYYDKRRFQFELDHTQANAMMTLFAPSQLTGGSTKWIPKVAPNRDAAIEVKDSTLLVSKEDFSCSDQLMVRRGILSDTPWFLEHHQLSETRTCREEMENGEQILDSRLWELAVERNHTNSSAVDHVTSISVPCSTSDKQSWDDCVPETLSGAANKNEETPTFDLQSAIPKLTQGMKDLKAFSLQQLQKLNSMEEKTTESLLEIQKLKDRIQLLVSQLDPSTTCANKTLAKVSRDPHSSSDELIYLLGGYDGYSSLSALDSYSPSRDSWRSHRPMSTVRVHAAAAVLDGVIYCFGGGTSDIWYDTAEAYHPSTNEWTSCSSLSTRKGSLAGAALNGKLFAIGGGNSNDCFSEVEMFDPLFGKWVHTQSMLQKRYAPASAALNGALYAVGGYNEAYYLGSAERFDPRATSWEYIPSMNTRRGCHSLVAFNEKLYAVGGCDGRTGTLSSVEVLDPRFGTWRNIAPMNEARGYAGAVVIGGSIYVIGGVQEGLKMVETAERYKEDGGWMLTRLTGTGTGTTTGNWKRYFFTAVVL